MITSIKAEFKKLVTVRSTYILLGLSFIYMVFYDFYIVGFRGGPKGSDLVNIHGPLFLMTQVTRASSIAAPVLFASLIAILLMAHEYRYNTILYTLTASNSRNKTFFSKLITITIFSILFSIAVVILAPVLALLGLHLHHTVLPHQTFYYREFVSRVLFYCWGYLAIGLILAIFFRNVVASIVAIFLIPVTIEPLIGLLLNANQQQYMPFTALQAVLNIGIVKQATNSLSAGSSALVALGYIVVAGAIAWYLFLKRDASS